MWDIRNIPLIFEVKADGGSVTFHSFNVGGGSFEVRDSSNTLIGSAAGGGNVSAMIATSAGSSYFMRYTSGFHVRPHWEGIEWARTGPGLQGAGPGANIGFQSDAELGFDERWGALPSQFADTTWFYNVAPGEGLSVSVEHMTGHIPGAEKFEWVSPSGTLTVADPDGMPGSGGSHFVARGGNLALAPNPASPYWEEYIAPVGGESGWWGLRLSAKDPPNNPYSWHYVLDRTDPGVDQLHYLNPGSILNPEVPEPSAVLLLATGLAALGFLWKRKLS
jgi:hypothetical protein